MNAARTHRPFSLLGLAAGAVLVLGSTGCDMFRGSVRGAPDRGGHAAGPVKAGAEERGGHPDAGKPPKADEQWHVFAADDTLYKVADQYNCKLGWLIARNDLVQRPRPGQQIVVPRQGDAGAATEPAPAPAPGLAPQ